MRSLAGSWTHGCLCRWAEGTLSSDGLCVKQEARPASGSNLTSKPPPTSAHPGAIPRSGHRRSPNHLTRKPGQREVAGPFPSPRATEGGSLDPRRSLVTLRNRTSMPDALEKPATGRSF